MFDRKVAILIFFLAIAVRVFYVCGVSHAPLENDAIKYDTLGIFLSQGKGYVNLSGEPTAFRPPIYPLFLGAIYYVTGHNLLWVRLLQALIGAGICVFVYLIAIKIFSDKVAILSGLLCSLYPPLVVNVSEIMTETLFTFLLVLGIWLIISKDRLSNLLLSGFAFGLALLTRPLIIFFFPFLFYWLVLHNKYEFPKRVAILIVGILIVLTPWTIRNYLELKAFVPLSNTGGLALYNSYMVPKKGFGFNSLESLNDEYFMIDNESDKNKYLLKKSIEYIKEHPKKVIQLAAIKALLFIYPFDGYWHPVSFGSKYNIFWGTVLCFSVLGIAIHFDDKNYSKKLIHFLFISFLIGIMLFSGLPRYRLPIDPFLICFAAAGFINLAKKKLHASSIIVFLNVMLFFIFRYCNFQELFQYFKNWI